MRFALIFISAQGLRRSRNLQARPGRTRRATSAPAKISKSRPWHEGRPSNPVAKSQIKDLRGGWYDAGDFNKYTSWAARYIIVLLQAYEEHPQAFSDDYGIPESGNGIPDILDEVKWGLDWLVRMQNPDGSAPVCSGSGQRKPAVGCQRDQLLWPSDHVRDPDGCGSLCICLQVLCVPAGAGSQGIRRRSQEARDGGVDLGDRKPQCALLQQRQFKAAGFQGACGRAAGNESKPIGCGRNFEAATYLFEMTGEAQFKQFADANYGALLPQWGPSMWEVDALDSLLYYARLPGVPRLRWQSPFASVC